MSLFPAYPSSSNQKGTVSDVKSNINEQIGKDDADVLWLKNQSYIDKTDSTRAKHSKKHKAHKHKRNKEKIAKIAIRSSSSEATNDDNSNFYVDVKAIKDYISITTLHKPACPRYVLSRYKLPPIRNYLPRRNGKITRYFKFYKKKLRDGCGTDATKYENAEKEFLLELSTNNDNVEKWIEYFNFKVGRPASLDDYQNAKTELEIVEKAMNYNPNNDNLLALYLKTIVKVYPMDEVLEIIQKLLAKDYNNTLLWSSLINNKQNSMAQCIVPNVLKLYEKSMRILFTSRKNDEIMLKLFKNSALFFRQSGLMEQFFAVIGLILNLNISPNFNDRVNLFHSAEHNTTLIEYEELILKSGLPMNEIWLRVEKLRSAFNYLPYLGTNICSDIQRIVINEDVCPYVYPLVNKEYAFDLFILILKLMKYPFATKSFERENLFQPENFENDQVEDILSLLLDVNRDDKQDIVIYNMVNELNTAPSFINTNLAYESYFNLLKDTIKAASKCFSDEKNVILLLLIFKLERIMVILEKIGNNLTATKKKECRNRIKSILKESKYQNNLNFYLEYGLIEYEMEGFGGNFTKIFITSVNMCCSDNDLYSLILSFVKILLKHGMKKRAVFILTKLAISPNELKLDEERDVSSSTKLVALQKFNERVSIQIENECNNSLKLEDYFKQNKLINSIQAHLYYMALIKSKTETIQNIEVLLQNFHGHENKMHGYLREQIYEIYLEILDFEFDEPSPGSIGILDRVLEEYPYNIVAIKKCAFSESLSWFKLRSLLGKRLNSFSVLLLVAAARYRILKLEVHNLELVNCSQIDSNETIYRKRICNLLSHATDKQSNLKANSLIWRLYLRELFDQNIQPNVLDRCKQVLYAALDACPWNKALYLDGAFFAPQELYQLLDLLLEKQLRIHAIPEELSILRNE